MDASEPMIFRHSGRATAMCRARATVPVLGALLLLGTMLAGPVEAASFTVSSGQTVTTTQTLSNSGDTGTIDSGGTISTSSGGVSMNNANQTVTNDGMVTILYNLNTYGISSSGADATITNNGTISTAGPDANNISSSGAGAIITNNGTISSTGGGSEGIYSTGTGATITNTGTLLMSGGNVDGIYSSGTDATITNSGTISMTTGYDNNGIVSSGADATITNSGTISASNLYGYGINSTGAGANITNTGTITTSGNGGTGIFSNNLYATITNSGTISTSGAGARGIWSEYLYATITNSGTISTSSSNAPAIQSSNSYATITNSGTISTSGNGSDGILSIAPNATITNSGLISATGQYADGIDSFGSDATITNSGLISATGTGSYAIALEGANPQLNLLEGSVLVGPVVNHVLDPSHLYVGNGLNLLLTSSSPWGTVATAGSPYVVSGNTVAVADGTPVAQQSSDLNDLSGGIFGTVFSAMDQGTGNGPRMASLQDHLAMSGTIASDAPVASVHSRWSSRHAWLRVFGGLRQHDGQNGPNLTNRYGGVMVGADGMPSRTRYGVFGGYAAGKLKIGGSTTSIASDSYFVGAYAKRALDRVDFGASAVAGYMTDHESRQVAYNLAPNGLETGTMKYHGTFIGLGVQAHRRVPLRDGLSLVPLARVRYTGLFQTTGTESGTGQNLTVDNPDIHLLAGRIQLGLQHGRHRPGDTVLTLKTGLRGRTNLGSGTADGTLLGQPISFDTGQRSVVGAFLGGGVSYDTGTDGVSLAFNTEVGREFGTAATTFAGLVGARVAF